MYKKKQKNKLKMLIIHYVKQYPVILLTISLYVVTATTTEKRDLPQRKDAPPTHLTQEQRSTIKRILTELTGFSLKKNAVS